MGRTLSNAILWPTRKDERLFACNFASLILLGGVISFWLFFRTDWFETFGSLLALGSLLSWLAFVLKIFPEDETKKIQKGLFRVLLERRFMWTLYLGLVAAFALGAASFGTFQLEAVQGGADYQVVIYPADKSPTDDDRERLPANGRIRPVKFLPWWSPQSFKVRVNGFPEQTFTLRPWWSREDRRVPFSFLRPVVLVGAERAVIQQAQNKQLRMEIGIKVSWMKSDETEAEQVFEMPEPYHGEAVWIGCGFEDQIDLPKYVLDWWKEPLANPDVAPLLLTPAPLSNLVKEVEPARLPADLTGARVEAWVKRRGDKNPYATGTLRVRRVLAVSDMVQLLPLEQPTH
jgi:hypothetical protein